jgi:hypothetical protein
MEAVKLLVLAGIFFALTPGILVKLPIKGSVLKVAAAHAVLFGLVYLVGTHLFQFLEGFVVQGVKPPPFVPSMVMTDGAARAGYKLLYINVPNADGKGNSNIGIVPAFPGPFPSDFISRLPRCERGYIFDLNKKSCIPVPSQYLLPRAPAESLGQTPNGGGWFNKTKNEIMNIGKPNVTVDVIFRWCPPGYVNNYDNSKPASTPGMISGTCVVAPTRVTSLVK